MLIAGDSGGTKTHLALFAEEGKDYTISHLKTFPSSHYPSLQPLVEEYLATLPADTAISTLVLAAAGPIESGILRATNLPWVEDAFGLGKALKISQVHFLNDLEAAAYALEILPQESLCTLCEGRKVGGNRVVVSPGTGLGQAGLFFDGERYHPFASEGGHSDFAPVDEREIALCRYLLKRFGHASYERILSGPGLRNVYDFLVDVEKRAPCNFGKEDPSRRISELALGNQDATCKEALEIFARILAQEAGNCALKFMAHGGVYLGGGIPPKILPFLQTPDFLQAFRAKGRFAKLLEEIPLHVILDEKGTLKGAAHYGRLLLHELDA